MEILIILITWFAVGYIFLINLTSSDEFEKLSDISRIILLLIFLPTTVFIYFIIFISKIINYIVRLKNDRANKRVQRSNKK